MKTIKRLEDVRGLECGNSIKTPRGNKGIFLGMKKDDSGKEIIRVVEVYHRKFNVIQYNEDKHGLLVQSSIEPGISIPNKYTKD